MLPRARRSPVDKCLKILVSERTLNPPVPPQYDNALVLFETKLGSAPHANFEREEGAFFGGAPMCSAVIVNRAEVT